MSLDINIKQNVIVLVSCVHVTTIRTRARVCVCVCVCVCVYVAVIIAVAANLLKLLIRPRKPINGTK